MIYIFGDDTGNEGSKYYVTYMIYDDGIPYLKQKIDIMIDYLKQTFGTFDRFHMKDLNNLFNVKDKHAINFLDGVINNSYNSVLDAVSSIFADCFEELVEKGYIIPMIFVTKIENFGWNEHLHNLLVSKYLGVNGKENIMSLTNVNKCIEYIKRKEINEEIIVVLDMVGKKEKTNKYRFPAYKECEITVSHKSSKDEVLLQMADFLAFSYNRIITKNTDDVFVKNVLKLKKYYSL